MRWQNWVRNSLITLGLLAVALFGVVFNTAASWLVTELVLAALILGWLSLVWPLRHFKLKLAPEQERPAGDDHTGPTLTVSGSGFFPMLTVRPQALGNPVFYRGQGVTWTVQKPLPRGVYHHLPVIGVAKDWLGWLQKQAPLQLAEPLVVGPRRERGASHALAQPLSQVLAQTLPSGDTKSFDLREFRDYQPGDPVNAIDWKLSARRDGLIVREDEPETLPQWQGVLVGQTDPQFERLLGLFTTLSRAGGLWFAPQLLTVGGLVPLPTVAQLATLRPAPNVLLTPLTTLSAKVGLVLFTPTAINFQTLQGLRETPVIQVTMGPTGQIVISRAQDTRLIEGGQGDA